MNPHPLPEGLHTDTLAVRAALERSQHGENSEALYLTSGYVQPNAASSAARFAMEEDGFTYSRVGNPTVASMEIRLAALEGTEAALATSSGMSAILLLGMALLKLQAPPGAMRAMKPLRKLLAVPPEQLLGHFLPIAKSFARATQEEEFSLELRTRDRERKLINKIESTINKIESKDYGFCEECGVEIGIKRLEARPTATMCIECKTLDEIREKHRAE
jgi:RNA polymerase-binding protein DksA